MASHNFSIETQRSLEAMKEAIERYPGSKCTDEEVEEYMRTSGLELEFERIQTQARLALDLQRRHEWRIFMGMSLGEELYYQKTKACRWRKRPML